MANLIGQHLGHYEITALLGQGGMATVYRARQLNIQREVAIKVIKPDLAEAGDFMQRFRREAETIAALSHPHILKLFDYGQQDGTAYLVMELLSGGSLSELIHSGPLSLQQAGRLLDQIAAALDYAHRRGVIHRDLKPANVLLDDEGNSFLTDFGIAKLLGENVGLTQTGAAVGTPSYMAPEQWQAQPVDARTDVYALGIILFEMLSGTLPFQGDTPFSMMHLHVYEPPRSIASLRRDVPSAVEQVIQRALAKSRDQRFPSAGELAAAYRTASQATLSGVTTTPSMENAATVVGSAPETQRQTLREPTKESTQPDNAGRRRSNLLRDLVLYGVVALIVVGGVMLVTQRQPTSTAGTFTATVIPTLTPMGLTQVTGAQTVIPPTPGPMPSATDCADLATTLSALQTSVVQITLDAEAYRATFAAYEAKK